MYYNDAFIRADLNYAHYQPASNGNDPNHAIAIVGWDNAKITQAEKPGAWLCKNSWGAAWGVAGYFWISYYDKHATIHPEMGAVSFQNVEPMQYDNIYYHDYHGWRGTLTEIDEAFNAFRSRENESLKSISFFTAANDVEYNLVIYDHFLNGELSGELATKSDYIEFCGFHTIDLDEPIPLQVENDFYVYLKLSHGGHPIDRTSEVSVLLGATAAGTIVESTANPGESYYRLGSTWTDLYEYAFPDLSWDRTANFCMKALTSLESPTQANSSDDTNPVSFELAQNFPNPCNAGTTIRFALHQPSFVTLKIYNLLGEEIITLVAADQAAGWKSVDWNGTDRFGSPVNSGVFVYRLEIEGKVLSRKLMVLK